MSGTVVLRDEMGRFVSHLERGGQDMLAEMAKDGANISRALAPQGHKPDQRTPRIVDSITSSVQGNQARWGSSARHALAQEFGARPHPITAEVEFFWEKHWRMWKPGPGEIDHPGNPAHPYLRPAYDEVMARWPEYARRHLAL